MRRIVGLVLIVLGVALIGVAVLLPTVAYSRVAKAPADPQSTIKARGENIQVLLPRSIEDGGTQILDGQVVEVSREVRGEVREGAPEPKEGQEFYRLAFLAEVAGKGTLNAYVEGGSFDTKTGAANNCCGDYLATDPTNPAGEPIEHTGQIFKFPFKTERKDYPFWDVNTRSAPVARFDGTERIKGLQTYRFVQEIPDTVIAQQEIPGALIGAPDQPSVTAERVYATTRTLWVEPYTGAIVKGAEQVNQRLLYNGKYAPIIVGNLEYTDETVDRNVNGYTENNKKVEGVADAAASLRLVTKTAPIAGWILGPILLLVGLTLYALGRRRTRDDEWNDEEQTQYQTV